jgi:hypothetical protein
MAVSRPILVLAAFVAMLLSAGALAAEPEAIGAAEFARIHKLVKPRPGESRWMEIDWYPSVWEARQRAAAEGKPIFFMAGSGGAPAAGC